VPLPKRLEAARQRVIHLYEAWGKPEKAEAWRKQTSTPTKPE